MATAGIFLKNIQFLAEISLKFNHFEKHPPSGGSWGDLPRVGTLSLRGVVGGHVEGSFVHCNLGDFPHLRDFGVYFKFKL